LCQNPEISRVLDKNGKTAFELTQSTNEDWAAIEESTKINLKIWTNDSQYFLFLHFYKAIKFYIKHKSAKLMEQYVDKL
jgi:hypothetical protein